MATFTSGVSAYTQPAQPTTTSAVVQPKPANTYATTLERRMESTAPETDIYNQYTTNEYESAQKPTEPFQYQAPVDPTSGKTAYDVQRERVAQTTENQRQQLSDAIRRRLAAQGISGGAENMQLRNLEVELAKSQAQGVTDIGLAELGAAEQERQAQEQRRYGTTERLGSQAFQRGLQTSAEQLQRESLYANLSTSERQLAEQGRQFNTKIEFDRWATEQGYTESEKARAWQSAESDKALAENARQFNTQQEFTKWATEQGWTQDAINRSWQANQADLDRKFQSELQKENLSFEQQKLAETAREFNSEQQFNEWATKAGYDQEVVKLVWQASENALDRASTERLTLADLTFREKQLSQDAGQFASRLEFDKWATNLGYTEAEKNRVWQATEAEKARTFEAGQAELIRKFTTGERLGTQDYTTAHTYLEMAQQTALAQMNIAQQDKQLAQQALQFTSQLDFNKWAEQNNLNEADATRIWTSADNAKKIAAYENMQIYEIDKRGQLATTLANLEFTNNTALEQMRIDAQKGLLDYQTIAQNKATADKMMADSYYARAAAGQTIPATDLEALKTSSPLAYYAYQSGLAGKDKAEVDADLAYRQKVIDALITSSAEDSTGVFVNELAQISKAMGIDSIDFTALTQTKTPNGVVFGMGDLGQDLMTNKTSFGALGIKSREDPMYRVLLKDSNIPEFTAPAGFASSRTFSEPATKITPAGSNNDRYASTELENAFTDGTPVRLPSPNGAMDLWTVAQAPQVDKMSGNNRTTYTMKNAITGQLATIDAVDGIIRWN